MLDVAEGSSVSVPDSTMAKRCYGLLAERVRDGPCSDQVMQNLGALSAFAAQDNGFNMGSACSGLEMAPCMMTTLLHCLEEKLGVQHCIRPTHAFSCELDPMKAAWINYVMFAGNGAPPCIFEDARVQGHGGHATPG